MSMAMRPSQVFHCILFELSQVIVDRSVILSSESQYRERYRNLGGMPPQPLADNSSPFQLGDFSHKDKYICVCHAKCPPWKWLGVKQLIHPNHWLVGETCRWNVYVSIIFGGYPVLWCRGEGMCVGRIKECHVQTQISTGCGQEWNSMLRIWGYDQLEWVRNESSHLWLLLCSDETREPALLNFQEKIKNPKFEGLGEPKAFSSLGVLAECRGGSNGDHKL